MARILDAKSDPIFDDVLETGTVAGLGDSVELELTGQSGVALSITDVGASVLTISFEASVNGVDFFPISGVDINTVAVANNTNANGSWVFACAGMSAFRARVTAWTSGHAVLAAKAGQGDGTPAIAGTVAISGQPISVDDNAGSLTVDAPVGTPVNVQVGDGVDTVEVVTQSDEDTNLDETVGLVTASLVYGRQSAGLAKPLGQDASTHALLGIDYAHHEIHEGDHYFFDEAFDLALNAVEDIRITTPNTAEWAHFVFEFETEAEYEFYLHEAAAILTVGTAYTPRNNNRNSGNASGLAIDYIQNSSVANANADTNLAGAVQLLHSFSGSGNKFGSAVSSGRQELILEQNQVYNLRFICNSAAWVNLHASWYEHTDKD